MAKVTYDLTSDDIFRAIANHIRNIHQGPPGNIVSMRIHTPHRGSVSARIEIELDKRS